MKNKSRKKRAVLVIKLIAVIFFIDGLMLFLLGLNTIESSIFISLPTLIISLLKFYTGIKLLKLNQSGKKLGVYISLISLIVAFLCNEECFINLATFALYLLMNVFIIIYLTNKKVGKIFK